MPDVVDTATRSRMMAGIRSQNTKPEIMIRQLLHRRGFRYRLHVKNLPGKPDIVLPKYGAVVLLNGCFWHGHDCALFKWPGTRADWWREKIERNKANDQRARKALNDQGWRIAVVWECALKGRERLDPATLEEILVAWLTRGTGDDLVIRGRSHE